MNKLTKHQKRDIRAIAAKRDQDIDFSDAPPVLDWSRAEIGKFYRPAKKPITIRLDSDVITWLKAGGPGYQTKANLLLRSAMLHLAKGIGTRPRKPAARNQKAAESHGKRGCKSVGRRARHRIAKSGDTIPPRSRRRPCRIPTKSF